MYISLTKQKIAVHSIFFYIYQLELFYFTISYYNELFFLLYICYTYGFLFKKIKNVVYNRTFVNAITYAWFSVLKCVLN